MPETQDVGNISGIELLLDSPPQSNHPDSDRQLDLCIILKTPGWHQRFPADLPDLEVVSSVHGSQLRSGSGTSGRQAEHSGRSAQHSSVFLRNTPGTRNYILNGTLP